MEMVTLPAAVIFGALIGLGVTASCCRRKRTRGMCTFCWRLWSARRVHLSIRSDVCERIAR